MKLITDRELLLDIDHTRKIIQPFDSANLTPAGIDLTIGGRCHNVTTGEVIDLANGHILKLQHGDFARVLTREDIAMPTNWFAMIYAKTSLAARGLTHLGMKIDPGFNGHLTLTFRNIGTEILEFREGDKICNVAFFEIPDPMTTYKSSGMKSLEIVMRPPGSTFKFLVDNADVELLGRYYTREIIEAYQSFQGRFKQQDAKVNEALRKIDETNRTLVVGGLVTFVVTSFLTLFAVAFAIIAAVLSIIFTR